MNPTNNSFWNNFLNVFNYNPNNMSGALDVILTQNEQGIFKSSPFHFRVGKFKVFNPSNRSVNIFVNGKKSSF